jgi:hypothetical protein
VNWPELSLFGDRMNKVLVALGVLLLVMPCGLTYADSLSSSIVCSGATWVSSSVISDARSYAAHLFTSDQAVVNRTLNIGEVITTLVSGRSTGPLGIDEYTGQTHNQTAQDPTCTFSVLNQKSGRQDDISTHGLFISGDYLSHRILSEKTVAGSVVNGSGILLTKAHSDDGNRTVSHASDIAGSMNVTEEIVFGEEEND